MKSTLTRQLVLSALSLSLTACATPVATGPVTAPVQVADVAQAPVAAPAQPAGPEAAPAAPAVPAAAQASAHVAGMASFGAEALSGYALKAYDAVTNAEVALSGTPMTDAKGAFDVTVAGVAAGRYVRLVATKAGVAVEATFAAGPQDKLALDATSTFLSQLAAGPLEVSGWATAGAADKATADYMALVQSLSPAATTMFAQQNAIAGAIVRVPGDTQALADQDAAYESALSNLGQVQAVTTAAAEIVKASAVGPAGAPAARRILSAGDRIKFRGTHLAANHGGGGAITLTNTKTGRTVEANDAASVSSVVKVQRPKHHDRSTAVRSLDRFPVTSQMYHATRIPVVSDGSHYGIGLLDNGDGMIAVCETGAYNFSGLPTIPYADLVASPYCHIVFDSATGELQSTGSPLSPRFSYRVADSSVVPDEMKGADGLYSVCGSQYGVGEVLTYYFKGDQFLGMSYADRQTPTDVDAVPGYLYPVLTSAPINIIY